jgi:hypothetical protein
VSLVLEPTSRSLSSKCRRRIMARICFVIMPFSKTASCTANEWTAVFETLIRPAVEGDPTLGYECRRSTATRGNMVRGIVEDLHGAHVVVADLTDRHANVFYELGVRPCADGSDHHHLPEARSHSPSISRTTRTTSTIGERQRCRGEFETVIRILLREIDEKPVLTIPLVTSCMKSAAAGGLRRQIRV